MGAFEEATGRFAAIHASDPRLEAGHPHAERYHERLAAWVERVAPAGSEALRLAARCQHLRRWASPRSEYPEGRAGYRRWRVAAARRTAKEAGEILSEVGYDSASIEAVQRLLLKEGLAEDAEVKAFEDAICLVFLESELEAFATKHDDEKLAAILRKTLQKMTPFGRSLAEELAAQLPERLRGLL